MRFGGFSVLHCHGVSAILVASPPFTAMVFQAGGSMVFQAGGSRVLAAQKL